MKNQALIFLIVGLLVGSGGTAFAMKSKTAATVSSTPANTMAGMSHEMTVGSDMSTMSMNEMKNELAGVTGDDFDKKFITEMIAHHQGAIDMATLAKTQAKHQEIKDLATNIIAAQTAEIAQMQAWQKSWGY